MNIQEWLNKVADRKTLPIDHPDNHSFLDDRKEYDIYVSKFDGSYIGLPGLLDVKEPTDTIIKFLAEHEVTEELTHGVGFSPKENKWYGWSHRAIHGFTIGSTCKRGDCHYVPANKEDLANCEVEFYADIREDYIHPPQIKYDIDSSKSSYEIIWVHKETGEKLSRINKYPDKYGRGEWVAETIEDAKQMAIDFSNGVS